MSLMCNKKQALKTKINGHQRPVTEHQTWR